MYDRGINASYLLSPSSKTTDLEHSSQNKLVKDPQSNRVNGISKNNTIPFISYNILLMFGDTDKKFEVREDLLKMINNKKYKKDHAISQD